MKATMKTVVWVLLVAIVILTGCTRKKFAGWSSYPDPVVTAQMKSFVAEKTAQANMAVRNSGETMPPELKLFFKDAENGDWLAVNNDFKALRNHAPQYQHSGVTDMRLHGIAWQAAIEIWGVFDAMSEGNQKYSALYANEIINSVPAGSIYFGGTDPGRFLISGMEKSQIKANPFFLITQNAMANGTYLDYVRSMYGSQLYIPTSEDSQKCFVDYVADAKERLQKNQLKPGENVQVDSQSGRVSVSGQVAVMEINGLLAKVIFDQNSNYDFYIEQSFPLDWMYPYLEPHGLILKLDRLPSPGLYATIVQQDHDYWSNLIQPMIGDWLTDNTSVQDIVDFAQKVFLHHDFTGFSGDQQFVLNKYSHEMFSKERANIADLYLWRAEHTVDVAEKQRMNVAADYACRQAWALCPYSTEATIRYTQLLMDEKRMSDALIVAETTAEFPSTNGFNTAPIDDLVSQLKQYQQKQ